MISVLSIKLVNSTSLPGRPALDLFHSDVGLVISEGSSSQGNGIPDLPPVFLIISRLLGTPLMSLTTEVKSLILFFREFFNPSLLLGLFLPIADGKVLIRIGVFFSAVLLIEKAVSLPL